MRANVRVTTPLDVFVVIGQLLGGGLSGAIATVFVSLIMSTRKKM